MPDEQPAATTDIRVLLRSLPVFHTDLPDFDPAQAPDEPVALFLAWLLEAVAAGVAEPHAMTLGTADGDGRPSARVLVCKDIDADGVWYFASGSGSRKGRELAANPRASLTFYWPARGRQIRITGAVTATDASRSAADFLARSPGARAEALLGRQSQVLTDPDEARALLEESEARIAAEPDLVAPDWTLYGVTADDVEFWQADQQRRHTRLRYRRTGTGWIRERLWS